jgi:integrase
MSVFKKQGVYWIDYYVNGHRKRERIGPDKRLAETVLRKRKVEIAEGRFLEKQRPITTTFEELAEAYWQWIRPDEVAGIPARKRSWKSSDQYALGRLRDFFSGTLLTAITPALVEQYQAWRRATISRHHRPIKPATVNRELECLKRMFTVARRGLLVLKGGVPIESRIAFVSKEREHNERDRMLSSEEFAKVVEAAEAWLKPIVLVAYHTGMRQGEIRSLRWDQVDIQRGLLRLKSGDTKTGEGRVVPLNATLTAALQSVTTYLGCPWVFVNPSRLAQGRRSRVPVDPPYHRTSIGHAFAAACARAQVTGATFHDLPHTFVTNARRAGVDPLTVMKITGHKTMAVFKRYNTVDEGELGRARAKMDTYMDTRWEQTTAGRAVTAQNH